MLKREPKDTDQDEVEKAHLLIHELMYEHPEIEPTLWAAAVWSVLVNGYIDSGATYDEFCEESDKLKTHCKPWFNK